MTEHLPEFRTVEAFVAWEERQVDKYEFADGVVSLFPGGAIRHYTVVMNVASTLNGRLGPGHVHAEGPKHLTKTSCRYPDVSVTFDGRDAPDLTYARFPTLIVEVLSPATQATDRGPKADEYRTVETLQEYVMIDSRKRWAQTMRRRGEDWTVSLPITSGTLTFESVGVSLSFDEVYAGTGLE